MSLKIQYVARVLSGVNQGAEALLPVGRPVVIGKSASSDIIFSGSKVAGRHVKIQQHGNAIELIPLAQPVYVDGKDVGLKSIILKPNQVVTIGDVRFAVNDRQQPWPTASRQIPKAVNTVEYSAAKPGQKRSVKASGNIFKNPWLWVALLGLVLVNIHFFTRHSGGLPAMIGVTKNVEEQLSDLVSEVEMPGVRVSRLANGITLLEGYVETPRDKEMLNKKVQRLGNKIRDRVYVDSNLENSAAEIAKNLGEYEVGFDSLEHGRLLAQGIINERHRWIEIREIIRSDVEGVISINDDEVVDLSEQFTVLKRKVEASPFSKRMELSREKGLIRAKAILTQDERKDWKKLFDGFQDETSYQFRLIEDFRLPADKFDLAIRTVSVGEVPYLVSKQGKKYFVGSHVGKGYYIESINNDNIVLNNNEIKFPVYFGRKDTTSDVRN